MARAGAAGIAPLRLKWRHIIPSAAKLGPCLREEFYGGLAFGVSSSHCFPVDRSLITAFDLREYSLKEGAVQRLAMWPTLRHYYRHSSQNSGMGRLSLQRLKESRDRFVLASKDLRNGQANSVVQLAQNAGEFALPYRVMLLP